MAFALLFLVASLFFLCQSRNKTFCLYFPVCLYFRLSLSFFVLLQSFRRHRSMSLLLSACLCDFLICVSETITLYYLYSYLSVVLFIYLPGLSSVFLGLSLAALSLSVSSYQLYPWLPYLVTYQSVG